MATGSAPRRLYVIMFEAADQLFDAGEIDQCIEQATRNLNDITLPPYYVIKNHFLIACAISSDNWNEANIHMLTAEQSYLTALQVATARPDTASLEALQHLRRELDEVIELYPQLATSWATNGT